MITIASAYTAISVDIEPWVHGVPLYLTCWITLIRFTKILIHHLKKLDTSIDDKVWVVHGLEGLLVVNSPHSVGSVTIFLTNDGHGSLELLEAIRVLPRHVIGESFFDSLVQLSRDLKAAHFVPVPSLLRTHSVDLYLGFGENVAII